MAYVDQPRANELMREGSTLFEAFRLSLQKSPEPPQSYTIQVFQPQFSAYAQKVEEFLAKPPDIAPSSRQILVDGARFSREVEAARVTDNHDWLSRLDSSLKGAAVAGGAGLALVFGFWIFVGGIILIVYLKK